MRIPRTMCTQHPDYANVPKWVVKGFIEGDDEVHEAYLAYSLYGCDEVMWDFEGKDVDIYVVRKLLSRYPEFFKDHVLGEDVYLTLRLPNPRIEVDERKLFAEALELIPTSYDVAREFYGKPVRGIFQVIMPMTSSWVDLAVTLKYYEKVIVGKSDVELISGVKVSDILGDVNPRTIDVIPLVEDMDAMLNVDKIIVGFWKIARPSYMRVFIARSDPAMNYGLIPAVLLAKIALSKAISAGNEVGMRIYPIIGVGPTPFRGNFNPFNVDNALKEYSGTYTYTVQSAFRYDYPEESVKEAIAKVNDSSIGEAPLIRHSDEVKLIGFIRRYVDSYQRVIEGLANLINTISLQLPPRRSRKLHIGLFGYSRGFRGITLPRAIPFVASLYSVGIPPEVIGLSTLLKASEEELRLLDQYYVMWRQDLSQALKFTCIECLSAIRQNVHKLGVNPDALNVIESDIKAAEELGFNIGPRDYESKKHELYSQLYINSILAGNVNEAKEYLLEMAIIRRALG